MMMMMRGGSVAVAAATSSGDEARWAQSDDESCSTPITPVFDRLRVFDVSSECSGEPDSPNVLFGSPNGYLAAARRPSTPSSRSCGTKRSFKLPDKRAAAEELQLIKEKLSKLLLGEDMSGSGKGVATAVAISNAITNLYATVFGGCHKLQPLPPEKRRMWRREMDCLLSVCDYMVEFFTVDEISPDGSIRKVMATRPRSDIYMNLPALEKLDDLLLEILDSFQNIEFWYADEKTRNSGSDKWWRPVPCVPKVGLSDLARKELQHQRDSANQIHKACMAINSSVLAEMEIPESYIDSLPKCGRDSVGDEMYRDLCFPETNFSPDFLLNSLAAKSEHAALAIADKVEAAMHVWSRKSTAVHSKNPFETMRDMVEGEKNLVLASRAKSVLMCLKQRFPALSQTKLDASKIQHNKDVGRAILESYSRVLESLAFNVVACIDDVLHVQDAIRG